MLEAEKSFLAILERIWPDLSWRRWSSHGSIPWEHHLRKEHNQGRNLWHQALETIIDIPEGVFQVTLKLISQNKEYRDESKDPFSVNNYFTLTVIDIYTQSGRRFPINKKIIMPEDAEYMLAKNLFLKIKEEAIMCATCRQITASAAVNTINTVLQNHFALA